MRSETGALIKKLRIKNGEIIDIVEGSYTKVKIIDKDKERHIEFLQKLISIDTTIIEEGKYGNEGNGQKWIADVFKDMGFKVGVFEPDNEIIKKYDDYTP